MRNAECIDRNLKIEKELMILQIAANIKILREERGLSQSELAMKVGISKQAVSNLELSNNFMSFETGLKLAKALGVTAEELAYGRKENEE